MAAEVHCHARLAFADHKLADPMEAGLRDQLTLCICHPDHLLGAAPNGGWFPC